MTLWKDRLCLAGAQFSTLGCAQEYKLATATKGLQMNYVLGLQALEVTFFDDDGPLSQQTCLLTQSHTSAACSTSSLQCDVVGEHYF